MTAGSILQANADNSRRDWTEEKAAKRLAKRGYLEVVLSEKVIQAKRRVITILTKIKTTTRESKSRQIDQSQTTQSFN